MDLQTLLRPFPCGCGQTHSCAIAHIKLGSGVLEELPELTRAYGSILLVADGNTFPTCGDRVEALLGNRLEATHIFRQEGLLVPNEEAVAALQARMTPKTDLILGIGSGVIQDLCKYVSFQAGLPYQIIATAPSMDGYASKGAAMILGNMKVTAATHVPQVIWGELEILRNAPMELIQSGYGDILGKYSCLNDWKLSALVRGESFCQAVYDLVDTLLRQTVPLGPKLLARDADAVARLMEALVGVGIAMAYVGNSRPASGSEHHLSHFFEITGLLENSFYFIHGTDVAYSAVYTQRLREQLLKLEQPRAGCHDPAHWQAQIRRIYGSAADGVVQLQQQLGWYREDRLPVYREKWPQIRQILAQAPASQTLIGHLHSIGLDMEAFDRAYGQAKIRDALLYGKDLKDRYSVLWLYYDLMCQGG